MSTALSPSPSAAPPARADLIEMYRRMLQIRRFEERASKLYREGEIPGFLHLSIGQEASAVGACWLLRRTDVITSTHRGHGHCIAKGLDVGPMFAELMGRATGTCKGRGGSMHIADPGQGIFGANGIVAGGLPIAVGAATAASLRARDDVTIAFLGDGATGQGAFHESLNLAAMWQLPVIFVCENNHFSEFSPSDLVNPVTLEQRASGYGIPHHLIDGNDVIEVARAVGEQVAAVRAGQGPVVIEADTYRWHGHYEGDPQRYRSEDEVASWRERDPLVIAERQLHDAGVSGDEIAAVTRAVGEQIDAAVRAASEAPYPADDSAPDFVTRPRPAVADTRPPADGPTFRMMDAVRGALHKELSDDPDVFVAGIDVGVGGGVFGLTRGLAEEFPERVRDTPISESAIVGTAVGSALAGLKPVVEIMYSDFLTVAMDQLVNQAAKLNFMTGGNARLQMVVRTQFAAGKSSGSQHSQSLESIFAHIPGLTVVMPSTPAETYGLLRAAIQDPNPVLFIENRLLYGAKGPQPDSDYLVPLGKARIVRPGTDVTLVSYSRMLGSCLEAAGKLQLDGIEVEVIDLRTIYPLDRELILESLARTHRLVVAHEAVKDFGVGAEVAALAVDEGFWHLDAPVARVGAGRSPAPYSPPLERAWLPGTDDICAAIRRVAQA